jgi:ParB family chromosome partitioning protein
VKLVQTFEREALEKVQGRPVTFADYDKLYKIEDEKKRNEALQKIGTRDFDWTVQNTLSQQEKDKRGAKIRATLTLFAVEETDKEYTAAQKSWELDLWNNSEDDLAKVKKLSKEYDATKTYYFATRYNTIHVYTKGKKSKSDAEQQMSAAEKERKARLKQISNAFTLAYTLRLEFAKNFRVDGSAVDTVDKMAIYALLIGGYVEDKAMRDMFGVEKAFRNPWDKKSDGETKEEFSARLLEEGIGNYNANLLFAAAYLSLEDPKLNCAAYNGKYDKNKKLATLYEWLTKLGYEKSSDETALLDGTSDLYVKPDNDAEDNDVGDYIDEDDYEDDDE